MKFTLDTIPGPTPEPPPTPPDTYKLSMDLSLEQLDQLHALLGMVTGATSLGRLTSSVYFKIDEILAAQSGSSGDYNSDGEWTCNTPIRISRR